MFGAVAIILSLLVSGQAVEDTAQAAAETWLESVDRGDYDGSWEESASLFRAAVSKEDWERTLGATRGPLGKLVARKLKSRTYRETLPGAPDGKYVILQYDTIFENKRSAVETVTPMLDGDTWRVSGYYIK